MTRRVVFAFGIVATLVAAIVAWKSRAPRVDPDDVRRTIAALAAERETLRARLADVAARDPKLQGAPDDPIRIGVPTQLVRELVSRLVTDVADRVTIQLGNLRVRRQGEVRRLLPLGEYDLKLRVTRVVARLQADVPTLTFGGNRIRAVMPVRVASGTGAATVDFQWDGRTVAGAVCGDMHVVEQVTGTVKPRSYSASATVQVQATETAIVLTPRIAPLRLHIQVEPSKASWATVQNVLAAKGGLCGFVLDRVNILSSLEQLMVKGFDVRVPVNRVRPLALPVGIEPSFAVRGETVKVGIRAADLSITPEMIWLGVAVYSRDAASAPGISLNVPVRSLDGRGGRLGPAGTH